MKIVSFLSFSLINSLIYIYKNKSMYGYGMISEDLLKARLKDILPEIIITYYDESGESEVKKAYSLPN